MVTSDSASRELEGVPFVPAGSEERRTHRSLRSAASFQRRSTALRAFACGENSLSCVRSERALASNLLEIEMLYRVIDDLFDSPIVSDMPRTQSLYEVCVACRNGALCINPFDTLYEALRYQREYDPSVVVLVTYTPLFNPF